MSQGIFGLIDFSRVIDDPCYIAKTMGSFLEEHGNNEKQDISFLCGQNYVLGMKNKV